jgi:aldehyde dehydrogenase (NAD+)
MFSGNTSRRIRNNDASGEVVEHRYLVVAGEWTTPHSRAALRVFSANTEQLIGSVPDCDRVDVDSGVRAARTAFDDPAGWSHWKPVARADTMRRLADAFEERSAEIARRVGEENGMPISSTVSEAHRPPQMLLRACELLSSVVSTLTVRG